MPDTSSDRHADYVAPRARILSLCDKSGLMVEPWLEAGFPCTVVVAGAPVTQGSMKVVRGRVLHSNGSKLDIWRTTIADAVHRQLGEELILLEGPLKLSAAFRLPRPASLPKKRRTWPIGGRSGDLDKLLRALGDAVTDVLIDDDAQIVEASVTKDWADPGTQPGVVFTIEEVADG